MTMLPVSPHDLSPALRGALVRLISLSDKKFTGTVQIELRDGGVQELRETSRRNGKQLAEQDLTGE